MLSRGVRNNNPGNIRKSVSTFRGEVTPSSDPAFKQFESAAWGYRAMFLLIHNYNELYGINTLSGIIRRWAPPVENDTRNYITVVARRLGISAGGHIDSSNREQMTTLVWAMSKIENGETPIMADIEQGWMLFCEDE